MRIVRRPLRGKTADSISMATSFNDTPMPLEYLHGLSIQASWSGSGLSGTIKLQASNHCFDQNVNNGVLSGAIWTDIAGSSVTISTNSGTQMWDISDIYYEAVRVVYTASAGTGNIQLYYLGKSDAS